MFEKRGWWVEVIERTIELDNWWSEVIIGLLEKRIGIENGSTEVERW